MKKILITILGLCLWTFGAVAAEPVFNEGAPESYTVKSGDTLWDISGMYLRDPWLWPEIWVANPQIENPHLIYPGDVIALVYVDGKPRLELQRGGNGTPAAVYSADGRTVKLQPRIKETAHDDAIPAIPLEAVTNFLARTRIVQPGVLEVAPYILAGHERRLISGVGDDFYARGPLESGVDFYGIYRKGEAYVDEETQEVLGIKAEDIGSAQLKAANGDVSTFLCSRSEKELRIGDRLLPHEEQRLDTVFQPNAPESEITGKIIDVEGGVTQVGTLNVVAINRGGRDGLDIGNVLAIYKAGEVVRDRVTGEQVTLPAERAGLLMVFRIFEKMSFGLVLTADRPLAVKDEVRNP